MQDDSAHGNLAVNGVLDPAPGLGPAQPRAVGEEFAPSAHTDQAENGDRRRFSFVQLEASPPANCMAPSPCLQSAGVAHLKAAGQ